MAVIYFVDGCLEVVAISEPCEQAYFFPVVVAYPEPDAFSRDVRALVAESLALVALAVLVDEESLAAL
jgi:hypothetical protein